MGFLEKPPWGILLGSYMWSFIPVAQLESCQKLGKLSFGRRKKQSILKPFRLKFKLRSNLKYFESRHSVNGIRFGIHPWYMNIVLWSWHGRNGVKNEFENCRNTVPSSGCRIYKFFIETTQYIFFTDLIIKVPSLK